MRRTNIIIVICFLLVFTGRASAYECAERRDVDMYVGIDHSNSMYGTRIVDATNFAADLFVEMENTGYLGLRGVYGFCRLLVYDTGLDSYSTSWLADELVSVADGGIGVCSDSDNDPYAGTALYDFIYAGGVAIMNYSTSNIRLLVILTDGEDVSSTSATASDAANAINQPGLITELIFVGSGSSALSGIADAGGSGAHYRYASASNLDDLIDDIMDDTCVNFRPDAVITLSDSDLRLGIDGFEITFDGSDSSDAETTDSGLHFQWTITAPDGTTSTHTGISGDRWFSDSLLPYGEEWSIHLVVTDPSGASDSTTRSFKVRGSPPDINVSGAMTIDALQDIALQVTPTTDIDGGDLTIVWDLVQTPSTSAYAPQNDFHTGAVLPPITTVEGDIGVWQFTVTATDNENDSDTENVEVEVRNLPPQIDPVGTDYVFIGESIHLETTFLDDLDNAEGGGLSFQWDVVQAPVGGIPGVQEDFSSDPYIVVPTTYGEAGTYIFRLTVTDDELPPYQASVEHEFVVLVDAPPEADITCESCEAGTNTISSLSSVLVLSAESSLDPDSPCPDQADRCHDTLDGRPVEDVSGGITGYSWSLVDMPLEAWDTYVTGHVDEVFGVPASGSTFSLGFGALIPGEWTFQVEVLDAEGNTDYTTYQVMVVDENGPPFAVITEPKRYTTDGLGVLSEDIVVSGAGSFDLDNLLSGTDPRDGITDYQWEIVGHPQECTPPALPTGVDAMTLYAAGTTVLPECQGWWRIRLTVTDDDNPAKTGSAETDIIIGNCAGPLCIDYPTTINPEFVVFTEDTDILIYYHLDSGIYGDSVFVSGLFAELEIFHESDTSTPVFTSFDPNLLASDYGGYLVFHWNGYTDWNARPQPGRYTIRITLVDYAFTGSAFVAQEDNAIWIETAEPEISNTSDKFVSYDGLVSGADEITIHYDVTGGISPDEVIWRVKDVSDSEIASGSVITPGTIIWDGNASGSTIIPGVYDFEVEALREGSTLGVSSPYEIFVIRTDIDVDADRDSTVEDNSEDDEGEDSWSPGIGAKGAIVLANSDDDDGNLLPDNWTGGDFDYIPGDEESDNAVNADPDKDDLGELVVRKLGIPSIPSSLKIVLRIESPSGENPYFTSIQPNDRVRVFLPSEVSGNDHVIQSGDKEIIGPSKGYFMEFVESPVEPQKDISIFSGSGKVSFGVEGIKYGSEVDLVLEFRDNDAVMLFDDRVRIKVAPFILNNHLRDVSLSPATDKTVYVEYKSNWDNSDLRAKLVSEYTADHVDEVNTGDPWHQDGYEIGYSKAPYGSMTVVLGLPRGEEYFNSLNIYTRDWLLRGDVGLIHEFQNVGFASDQDSGGNLECIPGAPERYLYGFVMNSSIIGFLNAQEVQEEQGVDTSWLAVGHVDEVVSYSPDGMHVLVASPEVAWALLTIASQISSSAPMLKGVEPFGLDGIGVNAFMLTYEDYNLNTVMDPANLPKIKDDLEISSPVSPIVNTGTSTLTQAGALIGFFPNSLQRTYKVTFTNGTDYDVTYQEAGSSTWISDGSGSITGDFVSSSKTTFILSDWWGGGVPAAGDEFTFTIEPTANWIEVPVLFRQYEGGAVAITSNNVNSLLDFERIVTPEPHGPVVDLGAGIGTTDIFKYYINRILERAGFSNIIFADDLVYHNGAGSIHCGTNVRRDIPVENWWE